MGPNVPDETKVAMTDSAMNIKAMCASLRKLGNSVEPGVMVSCISLVHNFMLLSINMPTNNLLVLQPPGLRTIRPNRAQGLVLLQLAVDVGDHAILFLLIAIAPRNLVG